MLDEDLARIRAHRNNIHRYQRLLRTKLSELERQFIERRLAEEQAAVQSLAAETFPVAFMLPEGPARSAGMGAE
ncbi:hypothetical protein [Bradyrhizobium zhanjiangense]|uniref:Uncharacterized protein n=1 Tax=Bradyrhizobium zhanjiangense TaxID=1325107 RepID=A0A4Q0SPM4_9BRAD|nr:hypothetical protein [Bradyrhizobium zhanjiangense]RXH41342.1 hypothetical protein XH94_09045 [Bradyrhizobium zhanjiangense]